MIGIVGLMKQAQPTDLAANCGLSAASLKLADSSTSYQQKYKK